MSGSAPRRSRDLTSANVTAASRIMLPTYVVLATYLGLLYIVDPQGRVQRAPGLSLAREMMPMPAWGACFLTIAALMTFALLSRRRRFFMYALYLYAVAAVLWAGIYLGATQLSPDASYGAPAWPLFVAVACHASARSLARGEVQT